VWGCCRHEGNGLSVIYIFYNHKHIIYYYSHNALPHPLFLPTRAASSSLSSGPLFTTSALLTELSMLLVLGVPVSSTIMLGTFVLFPAYPAVISASEPLRTHTAGSLVTVTDCVVLIWLPVGADLKLCTRWRLALPSAWYETMLPSSCTD
jgi:hypothetical protein